MEQNQLLEIINLYLMKRKRRKNALRIWKTNQMRLLYNWYFQNSFRNRMFFYDILSSYMPSTRSCPHFNRIDDIWERVILQYTDTQWRENFRVSRSTFNKICELLRSELNPESNPVYDNPRTGSVQKQVAVALYKLGSCSEYRTVGELFGIHKSTVHKYLKRVVDAILRKITPLVIKMPNMEDAANISHHFENACNLPQIIGIIDGSHVPVLPPINGGKDFYCRKGWPSILLQAVVDKKLRFLDVSCKFPGSVHDAFAFKGSALFKNHQKLIPTNTRNIDGKDIGHYIIGDAAYPLLPWLLKNYPGKNLTEVQSNYNAYMNSVRVCVEHAFGLLKGRFRMLKHQSDVNYLLMPKIVLTCCTLHNIIVYLGDVLEHDMAEDDDVIDYEYESAPSDQDANGANTIRNHLSNYIFQNFETKNCSF